MKTKKFKLNDSKWKKADIIFVFATLIPSLLFASYIFFYVVKDMNVVTFFLIMFLMLLINIPLYMIYLGIRIAITKNQKKNVVFEAVDNIDYYRDNLGELSPATISVLMNLDIENDKDFCAMLLYYKSKNIIDLDENKNIVIKNKQSLKESDLAFFNWLKDKNINNLYKWKSAVIKEAIDDGYLYDKKTNNLSKGCLLPLGLFMILSIIIIILSISIFNEQSFSYIENEFAKISETMVLNEQISLIVNNQNTLSFIIKMMLLILIIAIQQGIPTFGIIYFVATNLSSKRVKRTKLGNQLTERIYAMKNFIHDFGNLSEKTKDHLALWDYFLIYAVVLEENEQIVNEISSYRNINVNDFMIIKTSDEFKNQRTY